MAKKKKARPVKSSTLEKKKPAAVVAPAKRKDQKSEDRKSATAVPAGKADKSDKGDKEKSKRIKSVAGVADDGQKPSRLSLIKMRHEAIRREIDQIREDLESDEEE
jgi:hypothetical protein